MTVNRSRYAIAFASLAMGATVAGQAPPAEACSCVPIRGVTLSPPLHAIDVPRNARVLAYVPIEPGAGQLVLRQRKGAEVATSERRVHQGDVDLVELRPASALTRATEYEVLVRRAGTLPPNTVIGFFTTGADADTTPPTLGTASARVEGTSGRGVQSTCAPHDAYVNLEATGKDDRSLPLLFGIWVVKSGRSLEQLPDAIGEGGAVTLGKSSLCSLADYGFPAGGGRLTLAVSAIDSAGNASVSRHFDVVVPPRKR
jgi:hypothetical protein